MNKLNQLLDKFALEINHIRSLSPDDNNIFLGGMFALQLHGLKTPMRENSDLDIIIYSPTEKQFDYLDSLKPSENEDTDDMIPSDSGIRSCKIEKDGEHLDFLIEDKEYPHKTNILSIGSIQIQRIDLIIQAKLFYGRDKDITDIEFLIKENFINDKARI